MDDYYVYEHIRLDNNQCFYVGKGHGKRAYIERRNEHHDRIAKKYGMKVKIIAQNLSEADAYELERKTIMHYVYDLGYGIDIIGFNNNNNENGHLTNHTFGGDGSFGMVHSDSWRLQHSIDMSGENNPMYGINLWETYSEEKKDKIKKNLSEKFSGKNNPMYGISPQERMDEATFKKWKETNQKRLHAQTGSKNPNYGNNTLHEKIKDRPDLRIQYYSRPGSQNGRARKIELYNDNLEYINDFDTIGECAQWIKNETGRSTNINGMRSNISIAAKNNKSYLGFYPKFK